jgi:ACR3 family arsenite efflux pump ArsB
MDTTEGTGARADEDPAMKHIKDNLHIYMLLAIVLAVANINVTGGFMIPKSILIGYVVLFVIFPVLINSRIIEVLRHFREPRPLFCSLGINFIVSPAIAYVLARLLLSAHPELMAALLLLSLVPTSAMSVAWTSFSKGNTATALYLIPINILVAALFALPFLYPLLVGNAMQISTLTILSNLAVVFFLPLIFGDLTRKAIVRRKGKAFFMQRVKPALSSVSALGILGLIFMAMSMPRNKLLFENATLLLATAIPVLLYYGGLYLVSGFWSLQLAKTGKVPGDKSVVLVYTSVARHINICIALIMSTFALEQVAPMMLCFIIAYVVQVLSLAIFARRAGNTIAAIRVNGPEPFNELTPYYVDDRSND